jgi:hypothetical protein
MSNGKLLCVLGLASSLLAGYAVVGGVVGPWMARARALAAVHGSDGRGAAALAADLGLDELPVGGLVAARGRGVFGAYVVRLQQEGGL